MWVVLSVLIAGVLLSILGALATGATAMSRYEDRSDAHPYRRPT
jgi:hypothetical protein